MVRCKACGYIMKAGELVDRCPACGAPRTAFEPYTDLMSQPRRRILNIHLHPIAVHFPTSFAVALFVFSLAILFLSGDARSLLVSTNKILGIFMPLVVILAFAAGWIDGKIRFRKILVSQILKKKILYAVLLFIVSIAMTLVLWIVGLDQIIFVVIMVALGAAALVLSILLGLLGMSITNAAFPGK